MTTQQQAEDPNNSSNSGSSSPKPTKSQVRACQFSQWYPTFRSIPKSSITTNTTTYKLRKHVTIESSIITPLPEEFIEYLLSDGVRLPLCARAVSSCMKDDTTNTNDSDWDESDNDSSNNNSHDDELIKQYNFPTLTSQIQTSIETLGGSTMPKLNWSSPKDATWMNCGSLKCNKVGDVYLLLKSSEFVGFDLERAWLDLDDDEDEEEASNNDNATASQPPNDFKYELVLRKWCNLHPSMEFRCFIYNHELIAISQRHPTKFYKHLQPSSDQDEEEVHPITDIIHSFYETYVLRRFDNGKMDRYVMDVYVDSQERTWIVDFNVWGKRTDSLLFDWEELMEIGEGVSDKRKRDDGGDDDDGDDNSNVDGNGKDSGRRGGEALMPELRVVTKDMKDLTYDPLSSFRGPTDVMNLMGGSGGSTDDGGFEAESFQQFMEQCVRPSEM